MLTVVTANALYLAGLPPLLDPTRSMDPFYIHMAQQPLARIVSEDPAWGPLYAMWLKPFRAVLGDPLAVYTANVYGLSLAVSLVLFVYLLLLTRRASVAAGAALFFLVSDCNVPLASKVSAFALLVVLVGLTLSELVPAGTRRTSVAATGVLLASYARPELYPAALCLILAAGWLARRERGESGPRRFLWPATALAVLLIAALWIGTPLFSPYHSGDRLLVAFREHFARNWSQWHGDGRYFLSIWEQEFGAARTTLDAVLGNPAAVGRHLLENLRGTIAFMTASAFDHYPVLAPTTWPALAKAESVLVSAALFGSLLLVVVRPVWRRQLRERYGHALLVYVVVATFSFGAAIAIFPRPYYLLIPTLLVLLAGALAATLIIPPWPPSSRYLAPLAALACLAAIPKPFIRRSAYDVPGSPFAARVAAARVVTDTIALIRSLNLPPPVHVLTLTDGIGEMLGPGFVEIKIWQKGGQPLETYLRDNHVDVIVSMEPGRFSFVIDDPYWQIVQSTPDAAGFIQVPTPAHAHVRVYVRTELMRGQGCDSPGRPAKRR